MNRHLLNCTMIATLLALPLVPSLAVSYTGSLTYAGGGISPAPAPNNTWAGDLTWTVTDLGTAWQYEYDLTTRLLPGAKGGGGISHVIIEITPGAPENDFSYEQWDGNNWVPWTAAIESIGPQLIGSGNPGMPADMYDGIRFSGSPGPGPGNTHWLWRILTQHQPVWGDFYAKDGVAGTFFNNDTADDDSSAGTDSWSDDPTNAPADGSINNNILRPNGTDHVTPELSSGTLLLLGMLPMGIGWWRRRRTA